MSVDLKDELKNTAIIITCYDRDGKEVKRVTSDDDAEVEDNENPGGSNDNQSQGGSTGDGTTGNGDDNGGDNGGGSGGDEI